jgi:hypothetical protein
MTIEEDWDAYTEEYRVKNPFGDLKAIEVDKSDVNSELIDECIEMFIISEVSEGCFLAPKNIEHHLKIVNEYGIEPYLEERLRRVKNE